MVKVRKSKPVDEMSIVEEEGFADQLVDLARGFINEITMPEDDLHEPPGSEVESQACSCPRCKSMKTVVETSRPWEQGMKVRYMRCRACRMAFKDVQSDC